MEIKNDDNSVKVSVDLDFEAQRRAIMAQGKKERWIISAIFSTLFALLYVLLKVWKLGILFDILYFLGPSMILVPQIIETIRDKRNGSKS